MRSFSIATDDVFLGIRTSTIFVQTLGLYPLAYGMSAMVASKSATYGSRLSAMYCTKLGPKGLLDVLGLILHQLSRYDSVEITPEIGGCCRTSSAILRWDMNDSAYGSVSGSGMNVPASISSAPGSSAK